MLFRSSRPPGGGGFGGPRPGGGGFGGGGGFRPGGPPRGPGPDPSRFGPPKKKSAGSEKRWENKERGPKGPIKERFSGRMDGLYDDPNDTDTAQLPSDFDDPATKGPDDDGDE